MKRKQLYWAACVVAIALLLCWALWSKFASTTKIALVEFQPFQAASLIKANNDNFISYEIVSTDNLNKLSNYDFVLGSGMGMRITAEQREQIRKAADKGTPLYIHAATNPDNRICNLDSNILLQIQGYLNNGNKKNYQSLAQYIRYAVDKKKLFVRKPDTIVSTAFDVYYHLDENISFSKIDEYENYLKENNFYIKNGAKIAIVGGLNDPFSGNKENIDSIIVSFMRAGFNVYPVASFTKRMNFLREINPDAVIYFPHGRLAMGRGDMAVEWLKMRNIPIFAPLSMLKSKQEWENDAMGMFGGFLSQSIVMPELDGAIYPYVINSQEIDKDGIYLFRAIPERLKKFTQIVKNFVSLKKKNNADRKISVYFFKAAGHQALTAQGLEVVPSLYNLLKRLKIEGYKVENLPESESEFAKMLRASRVKFGNVALLRQPMAAAGSDTFAIIHGAKQDPPQEYINAYLWSQDTFKADIMLHFGTHGSLEFTPQKQVALCSKDFPDMLVGTIPHFYYYTIGNVGESIMAKRRSYATIISYLTPPFMESGTRSQFKELNESIKNFYKLSASQVSRTSQASEASQVSETSEASQTSEVLSVLQAPQVSQASLQVKKIAVKMGLHRDLRLDSVLTKPYTEEEIERIENFAEEIASEKITGKLYILGVPYEASKINSSVEAIASVEPNINKQKYKKAFEQSPEMEMRAILNAFSGGYTPPSSGGDAVANPNAIPTGRNLYAINAEITPSEKAWDRGVELAKSTLEKYKQQHKDYPRKISYTFWSSEFIESEGTTIAQAFYMLGVEPIRDKFGRVTDLRLIPSEELGRPRIDIVVQTSGQFRDLAASRLSLLQRAVEMAAASKDDKFQNQVSQSVVETERALVEQGISPKDARELSANRIFGGVNGMYGTGIQRMVTSGDKWEDEKEIAQTYINNMGATYGNEEKWGAFNEGLLRAVLNNTDVVIQPRQSNTWGALSLDHVYEFMGGINLAVRNVTGKDPDAYFADYRNRYNVRIQELKEAIGVEARTTVFNPVYIKEVLKGGATSASQITEIVTNTYGWNVMKPDVIDGEIWNQLYDIYIKDVQKLDIQKFFKQQDPAAMQEITAVMLETSRKGMWKATAEQLNTLANLHTDLVKEFGIEDGGFSAGNKKLQNYISQKANVENVSEYKKQIEQAEKKGIVMKKQELSNDVASERNMLNGAIVGVCVIVAFVVLLIVMRRKRGVGNGGRGAGDRR
ncbi:MAG: cobaltochelatase subunit CobN [Bacteroidales bacterium]|jgi:cobaltochelatase CobN|nr:cobaltochelatase subunit CobN [Bacteroidales bacterium]